MGISVFMCNIARSKRRNIMHIRYFSETTLRHQKPQQGLSERHRCRTLNVTLFARSFFDVLIRGAIEQYVLHSLQNAGAKIRYFFESAK